MKVGVFLFPESRDPSKDGQIIDEAIEEVKNAERMGADAAFLAEHHFDGNCAYVDPPTFAAALSGHTSRIKIGFAVLQTSLYHPLRMAEQISLLDHLTKGRLIVGLGRGSMFNSHEYSGFQIDPATAQERFDEIESILFKGWESGRLVHRGKYWNFDIEGVRPRPFTHPHPQVLRSVSSEASVIGQAKKGRPVILGTGDTKTAVARLNVYKSVMLESGFSAEQVNSALSQSWCARPVIVAPTDREAIEVGFSFVKKMQEYRATQSEAFQARVSAAATGEHGPRMPCGAPQTVLQEFKDIQATGVGGVVSRFRIGPMPVDFARRSFELFMTEVLPELKKENVQVAIPA